jgi:hypothetical protein
MPFCACFAAPPPPPPTLAPHSEKYYKDLLRRHLYPDARSVKLPGGVTDLTTDGAHVEVKRWELWKEALGQLLVYDDELPRATKAVYFYGPTLRPATRAAAVGHLLKHGMRVYELAATPSGEGIEVRDAGMAAAAEGATLHVLPAPIVVTSNAV